MSRYLDEDGLRVVADNVNRRLKTVTEMPATGDSVLLYIGETTENYTRGHIYQFQAQYWFCYKTVPEIDPSGPHYIYLNEDKTKYGNNQLGTLVTSSDEFTNIEGIQPQMIIRDDGIYVDNEETVILSYVPDIEHDLNESEWVDITDTEAIEVASGAMALAESADNKATALEQNIALYNSYSFDEKWTGGTWVDGKKIYKKTYDLGTVPSPSSGSSVYCRIPFDVDFETVVEIKGMIVPNENTTQAQIEYYSIPKPPRVGSSDFNVSLKIKPYNNVLNLELETKSELNNKKAYATVYYTKINN